MNEDDLKLQVQEFQNVQAQLQMLGMQLQQLNVQESETQKALDEIDKGNGPFYRFVSNILVEKEKETLKKELTDEKDTISLRVSSFKKQEDRLKPRFDELRKRLEEEAKKIKQGS